MICLSASVPSLSKMLLRCSRANRAASVLRADDSKAVRGCAAGGLLLRAATAAAAAAAGFGCGRRRMNTLEMPVWGAGLMYARNLPSLLSCGCEQKSRMRGDDHQGGGSARGMCVSKACAESTREQSHTDNPP